MFHGLNGVEPRMFKHEVIGSLDGIPVAACTDSGGSQVIIGGHKFKTHLLSDDFGDHRTAVHEALEVIRHGIPLTKYYNLKDEHEGFTAFGAMMITANWNRRRR